MWSTACQECFIEPCYAEFAIHATKTVDGKQQCVTRSNVVSLHPLHHTIAICVPAKLPTASTLFGNLRNLRQQLDLHHSVTHRLPHLGQKGIKTYGLRVLVHIIRWHTP